MKKILSLLVALFFLFNNIATAQEEMLATDLDTTSGVALHTDPRLDILLESHVKVKKAYADRNTKMIRSSKGYRIQIYNGNSKSEAIRRKVDFMKRYPGIPTYMTYTQPMFRVKVGNYTTRKDAYQMVNQIRSLYTAIMVVPDFIVINTFHK